MSINDYYTHTVEVQRLSHTDNDYGGSTATFSQHIASYSCRIYRAAAYANGLKITDAGEREQTTYSCIGGNADILEGDKLVDGSREYLVKQSYKVYDDSGIHHLRLEMEMIEC